MKSLTFSIVIVTVVLLLLGVQNVFASTIMGIVYDDRSNCLADVDIELLDELSRMQNRTRTDGSGRYKFAGLSDGRYIVRVLPFKYDLIAEEQTVEIKTVSAIPNRRNGAAIITEDFYLRSKKNSFGESEPAVIFAQNIPNAAKAEFDRAVEELNKNRHIEGLAGLQRAIGIFPDYFLALQRLGKEYFLAGKFAEAVPLLMKAAEVYDKSSWTLYLLGYSLHKLGHNKAAIIALERAASLDSNSSSIYFVLGTAERLEGHFANAEQHLKRAKELSKAPFPDLYWQLAILFATIERFAAAADAFEQFLKERPNARDADKIRNLIKSYRDRAKHK